MPHIGLADPIEAVVLYQLDNPAETGFHVGRQDIELFSNPIVQQFYDPRHLRALLHFCNSCCQPVLATRSPFGARNVGAFHYDAGFLAARVGAGQPDHTAVE